MFRDYNFPESKLTSDIAKRVRMKYPALTKDESLRLAGESVEKIVERGESSIYEGLIELGKKYAINLYGMGRSESKNDNEFGLG